MRFCTEEDFKKVDHDKKVWKDMAKKGLEKTLICPDSSSDIKVVSDSENYDGSMIGFSKCKYEGCKSEKE